MSCNPLGALFLAPVRGCLVSDGFEVWRGGEIDFHRAVLAYEYLRVLYNMTPTRHLGRWGAITQSFCF